MPTSAEQVRTIGRLATPRYGAKWSEKVLFSQEAKRVVLLSVLSSKCVEKRVSGCLKSRIEAVKTAFSGDKRFQCFHQRFQHAGGPDAKYFVPHPSFVNVVRWPAPKRWRPGAQGGNIAARWIP